MKTLVLTLALLISSTAFGRQYMQCSSTDTYSTDVMVVNLQTTKGGTLFISSGMQNPEDERTLVNIELDKVEEGKHIYKVVNEAREGFVAVPSSVIGKSTDFVTVELSFNNYQFTFSCFAPIYND